MADGTKSTEHIAKKKSKKISKINKSIADEPKKDKIGEKQKLK